MTQSNSKMKLSFFPTLTPDIPRSVLQQIIGIGVESLIQFFFRTMEQPNEEPNKKDQFEIIAKWSGKEISVSVGENEVIS